MRKTRKSDSSTNPFGCRTTATVCCFIGAVLFIYNGKKIMEKIS